MVAVSPDFVDSLAQQADSWMKQDHVFFTFDDGWQSNFEAAKYLHKLGIKATFFIVPSLAGRTVREYIQFHEDNGVSPYAFGQEKGPGTKRGLSVAELVEMAAMGHRIGAHNYAHRDLGKLHDSDSLEYEIGRAVEEVGRLMGRECRDFAVAFGQPENISREACDYLLERDLRVYMCFRGLNVPGKTPRFMLRHGFEYGHPFSFTSLCLDGGCDHTVYDRQVQMIERVGYLPGT